MAELKTTRDPAALAFLFTEDLYSVKEKAPATEPSAVKEPASPEEPSPPERPSPLKSPLPAEELPAGSAPKPAALKKSSPVKDLIPGNEEVFHYLGENRRFVLVLVNYPEEKYLPAAEKEYLEKILSAVKLNLEDIALLNYARYSGKKYTELKDFFAFAGLLLFGVAPQQLSIPGPVLPYHLGIVEGVKILGVDSTEILLPDPQKKKQLWAELQKMFS